MVIARAVVRDLYSGAALAHTYSRLYFVVGAAPVLAPVIGTQVLKFTSWRGIFVVLFAFGAALLALSALRLPETLPSERRTRGGLRITVQTFRTLLRHRGLVGYALTLGCGTAALVATVSGAPFVVQNVHGQSPQVYGVLVLVGGLAVVGVNQLNARLLRTFSAQRLLTTGFAGDVGAAVALLVFGDVGVWPFVACFVALFAMYGFIVANATALALREQAAVAGAAAAFVGLVQYGMGALAAPLAGISSSDSVVPLGIVVSSFAVAGFVGAVLTTRSERRQGATASGLSP